MDYKQLHRAAFALLIVGGLNWLMFALLGYDIGYILGGMSAPLAKVIYLLVGAAAIYEIVNHRKTCKVCEGKGHSA